MSETRKRIPRREMTARKDHFRETDEVLELFERSLEDASKGMKTAVLFYSAETGAPTVAFKEAVARQQKSDEYPFLRAMGIGFTIGLTICLIAFFIASVV